MRLWHLTVRRPGLVQVAVLCYDQILRDWREEPPRILAASWLGAEALIPAGLIKLSVGESGAWFGPRELAGSVPSREMASLRVRTIGTVAA